jgi:peptidoglycan/xylan/chitin deacetylase (PgdA/CDA1 family)
MFLTASILSAMLLFSAWLSTPLVPQIVGQSFRCVNTQEKVVALTFDDGPNPEGTPAMLDLLARYNIQATFFLIGNRIEQNPALAQRVWQAGHQVGNHTWSHTLMMFKSPSYLRQEIEKTDAALRGLGHPDEIFFRAPYGMKLLLLPLVLRKMNKKSIIFDSVAWDWSSPGVEKIVNNVMTSIRPGSIILLHEGVGNQQETIVAVEEIIKQLMNQGYRFVTVAQLLTYHQPVSWLNTPYACLAKLQGLMHSGSEWVSKKCYLW